MATCKGNANVETRIESLLERFGVVTAPVLADWLWAGDTEQAEAALSELVAASALSRYRFGATECYLLPGRRIRYRSDRRALRDAYATLEYCRRHGVELLSEGEFFDKLSPGATELGLFGLKYQPAYIDALGRISPVRVHHIPKGADLSSALVELDNFVALPQSLIWWHLAREELCSITFLTRGDWVEELARWREVDPLLSYAGGEPVEIPVIISEEIEP